MAPNNYRDSHNCGRENPYCSYRAVQPGYRDSYCGDLAACPLDDPLAGPLMGHKTFQRSALRAEYSGCVLVVVETRTVRQHQIAFHVVKGKRPMPIEPCEFVLS